MLRRSRANRSFEERGSEEERRLGRRERARLRKGRNCLARGRIWWFVRSENGWR